MVRIQKRETKREEPLLEEDAVEPGCVAVTRDCPLVWTKGGPFWFLSLVEGLVHTFTLGGCVEVLMGAQRPLCL